MVVFNHPFRLTKYAKLFGCNMFIVSINGQGRFAVAFFDNSLAVLTFGSRCLTMFAFSDNPGDRKSRLIVGSRVSIRLQGAAVKRLDGTIVRSQVSTIHRDGSLSYESGVDFDRPSCAAVWASTVKEA